MRVLPRSLPAVVAWFESRLDAWSTDPDSIGLSIEQIERLGPLVARARAALDHHRDARRTALAATPAFRAAAGELQTFGSELIKIIKATAESAPDASIYGRALVPPAGAPSPTPPPVPPTGVRGEINPDGSVTLSWDASLAHGIFFEIERRLVEPGRAPTGDWTLIGAVQSRRFIDADIPTGLAAVSYRLRAHRDGHATIPTAPVDVLFGTYDRLPAAA